MSGITSASRRSSSPGTKAPPTITPKAFESFLTHLSFYDTLLSETPGSNATDMVKKKKQEDILKFIQTFHTRTLSQVTSGRYAGFWQTRVGTGRENSRYIRTKSLEEMLDKLGECYGLQLSRETRSMTLALYFPHWLEWKAERNNNKAGTARHNTNCFNRFVKDTPLSRIPLTKITTENLCDWARATLKAVPLSSKRFNTMKIVVTGPLELAVREGIINDNPWKKDLMDYQRLLRAERKAPSSKKIFYPDEIEAIIRTCMQDYEATGNVSNLAVVFNFDMGLRVGELCALRWEDVNWRQKSICIRRQESEGRIEEAVKSDSAAGYRELPLNGHQLSLLKRIRKDTPLLSPYIFSDPDGKRKTAAAIQNRLIYAHTGKHGSMENVKRIHCQRRTVATRIAKDRGLEAARQWLGHTDLMTTLRYIYTNETLDSMREYSEEVSALKVLDSSMRCEQNRPDSNMIATFKPVSFHQDFSSDMKKSRNQAVSG